MPRFKVCFQREQEDCGIACLVMILHFYGAHSDMGTIKSLCGNLKNGISIYRLNLISKQLGFHTQAVRLTVSDLQCLQKNLFPFICFWKQNHFIVVYKITSKYVYVADPALGKVKYRYNEFCKFFFVAENKDGFALLLKPDKLIIPTLSSNRNSGIDLRKYIKSYWRQIVWVAISIMTISGIGLIFPFLSRSIIDDSITPKNPDVLIIILCATISLAVGRLLFNFLQSKMTLVAGTLMNIDIAKDLLLILSSLPMSFFVTRKVGDIIQRVSDVSRIGDYFSSKLVDSILSTVLFCIYGGILFHLYPLLFGVFGVGTLIYVGYNLLFLRRRKILDYESFSAASKTNEELIQFLRGMTELKLACAEQLRLDVWQKHSHNSYVASCKSLSLSQMQTLGSVLIMEIVNAIIVFLIAKAVIDGSTTLGSMVAIQYIVGSMESPLHIVTGFISDTQKMRISLERINYIASVEPEKKGGEIIDCKNVAPQINIDSISFSYDQEAITPTLYDINVEIPSGYMTALVGMSGSGKTTFIKLLLGFYMPSQGEISINGIPLADVDLNSWRKNIGIVMQDSYIFSDTIVNNVALGESSPQIEKVIESLRTACADFVFQLPMGINTIVGAEGLTLSAGQRQRLLLARAIYKNPSLYFLDEATNALDAINEKNIYDNLSTVLKGKTVVVAAHRLSTICNAHQILVFDHGRIVEKGTHDSLLLKKGKYSELIKNQLYN